MRGHFESSNRTEEELGIQLRMPQIRETLAIDKDFVGAWDRNGCREYTDSGPNEVKLNSCVLDIGGMIRLKLGIGYSATRTKADD